MDGLPGRLPDGEQVLWQSGPQWKALAYDAFRLRLIAIYFSLLVLWRIIGSMNAGHDLHYAIISATSCIFLGVLGIGLFCFFAWLIARTTTYTITQKRVVLTYGMALPKSLNLPLATIQSADMHVHQNGTGNIALALPAGKRLSYLLLWPHVRPGPQGRAQPMLRCIPAPEEAANILSQALTVLLRVPAPQHAEQKLREAA